MSTLPTTIPPVTSAAYVALSPLSVHDDPVDLEESNMSLPSFRDTTTTPRMDIKRSGSPTPSEAQELSQLDGTMRRMFRKESWKDRSFLTSLAGLILVVGILISITVFQDDIVTALSPASEWVRDQPAGFLIPLGLLIVLSIPPLFGAEIVNIICGLIYGLGIGLVLVLVGTIIGESVTYFAYRYWFRAKAEKMEKGQDGSLQWPSLARVIREGGFKIAVVVKYCMVPSHITTALFSVCGINYWIFLSSTILAFPKAVLTIWIGAQGHNNLSNGEDSTLESVLSAFIFIVTVAVTVFAARLISRCQKTAALAIIRERRATLVDGEPLDTPPMDSISLLPVSQPSQPVKKSSRLPKIFRSLPFVKGRV